MIEYRNTRYDQFGPINTLTREFTLDQAMHMLIDVEFSVGTQVSGVGSACVNLTTGVFGTKDEIIFDGPDAEMSLLVEAASLYKMLESAIAPRTPSQLHNFALGCTKAEAVTKMLIANKCKGVNLSYKGELKDLITVMLLIRTDNVDAEEALSLLH